MNKKKNNKPYLHNQNAIINKYVPHTIEAIAEHFNAQNELLIAQEHVKHTDHFHDLIDPVLQQVLYHPQLISLISDIHLVQELIQHQNNDPQIDEMINQLLNKIALNYKNLDENIKNNQELMAHINQITASLQ